MTTNREKLVRDIELLRECEEGKWTRLLEVPTVAQEMLGPSCPLCEEYDIEGSACLGCPLNEDNNRCRNESTYTAWIRNYSFETALAMRDAIVASRARREERLRVMDSEAGKESWHGFTNGKVVTMLPSTGTRLRGRIAELSKELADISMDLRSKTRDVEALDLAAEINTATIRNMGDERERLRTRERALREEIGERAKDYTEAETHVKHLSKYARHHENCSYDVMNYVTGLLCKVCTCGFDQTPQLQPDAKLADDIDKTTAATLDRRSVTIRAEIIDDGYVSEYIGPISVAKAIEEERGIKVDPAEVEFTPRRELGVYDATIHFGGHEATVKVWIVKDAEPIWLPDVADVANLLRMICTVADNAMPLGQGGALRDVVMRCGALLGKEGS